MRVGRITLSDRASRGEYADLGGPEIERVVAGVFAEAIEWHRVLMPDCLEGLARELRRLADREQCHLILTTGGTGPACRDFTPEATRAVLQVELPGFGEAMRAISFQTVPTAILSRGTAGVRARTLIVNLPGRPAAIATCLVPLAPAIVEAIDHIAGVRFTLRERGNRQT
ncbi:MAG: molybdopterin adenylyltransferase [Opitutus sp.]|nr:molybdopterin adenylyltransferase [Opitutus sp.]